MAIIWLIEDNLAYRNATQFVLNRHPELYSLQAFESCEDALAEMKRGGKPAVILLDVELPGLDGIRGIPLLKELHPEVSVLILTVFEDDEKIFRAICAGASGYLLKSEPLANIAVAVDQAIEGGAPMNTQIARRVLSMFSQMAPVKKDYGLTDRERLVLELMGEGLAKKQIADRLSISTHTVNSFVRMIYKRLHVNCQTAAISLAVREGIIGKD